MCVYVLRECFSHLRPVCLIVCHFLHSRVFFLFVVACLVPVAMQATAWKDLSAKWPVISLSCV